MTIKRWLPDGQVRVLNVGCGTLPLPGRRKAWRIVNLEVARRPFPSLVLYDGTVFPFQDGSFGAVLCLDVLEHVQDDGFLLREIRRVLNPGGVLVLTTPATEHDFRELRLPLGRRGRAWPEAEAHWGHVRQGYNVGSLVGLCQDAGLAVVGVEKYAGAIAHALFQLWYLADLAWLFSRKLVLPRLLMEIALRMDHLFWRNRGCAIAIKAVAR